MATTQAPATTAEAHAYAPPVAVVVKVEVTALAFREADGSYSVVIPELPGCYSAADSIEEVEANAGEAARGWIAVEHERSRDDATAKIVEPLP
jgi:predicted RNase H-like HicB family nuclease